MPELPEVEVSRMGISPHLIGQTVKQLTFRCPKLRWPIPAALHQMEGQPIEDISRRAKYLLIKTPIGRAIVHLG
ncbi:DNA-formamidopyrimidine glycosylase family protein, partial [Vibrio fujianensis]